MSTVQTFLDTLEDGMESYLLVIVDGNTGKGYPVSEIYPYGHEMILVKEVLEDEEVSAV